MTESTDIKKPIAAAKPRAAKAAKAKTAAPKPVANKPAVPAPKVRESKPATDAPPAAEKGGTETLRMKDLLALVTEASGGKKKGVKEIVEATLAALSGALSKGNAINLPGFGRAKVAHAEDIGGGKPMTIKLRTQSSPRSKSEDKDALAEAED